MFSDDVMTTATTGCRSRGAAYFFIGVRHFREPDPVQLAVTCPY
jgi:hypothetical protein